MRFFRHILIVALTVTFLLGPVTPGADAANCQFTLGFKTLHDLIPATVGNCLGNEVHSPCCGDAIQRTTKGMLVWRKADNATAFTDGYHSWILGPFGLQERLNSNRFPWEADYMMIFDLNPSDFPSGTYAQLPSSGPVTKEQQISSSVDPATVTAGLAHWGWQSAYQESFLRGAPMVNGQAALISSAITDFKTASGAQAAWNYYDATAASVGWQTISAPAVGDQSVAFFVRDAPASPNDNVDFVEYQVFARVGQDVFFVTTTNFWTGASPDQAIALARLVAARLRSRR
ncbi:MAG TPA: hypothetical protein VFZ25_15685 [Chloroflexota bacterium]|nr:hypothetical protein [Chloroflexota bacterium]